MLTGFQVLLNVGISGPQLARSQASCLVLKSKVSEASVVGGGCYIFIDTGHTVGAKPNGGQTHEIHY